ncbi:hypothetical protein D3C84_1204100 [compost metagenome]
MHAVNILLPHILFKNILYTTGTNTAFKNHQMKYIFTPVQLFMHINEQATIQNTMLKAITKT